jgi:hypothetical protein
MPRTVVLVLTAHEDPELLAEAIRREQPDTSLRQHP